MTRLLVLVPLLLAAEPVHAQASADDPDLDRYEAAEQRDVRQRDRSPDADVHTGFAGSGLLIAAGGDETDVSLTFSRSWDGSSQRSLSFNTASLKLTAPITEKDRQEGAFLTESGLPNAIAAEGTLTVALSRNLPSPGTADARFQAYKAEVAKCLATARGEAARKACKRSAVSTGPGEPLLDAWNMTPVWFIGLSGSVGRKEIDYRNLADFAKMKARRTEYAFSGFVGVNPDYRAYYFGAGYEYRRTYDAPKSRTLCQPAAAGTPGECFTAAFAEPEREIDSSLFAVARWQGKLPLGEDFELPIGVAIKAAYDTKDKVFGIGLPVYLFSDGKGLRGGVRLDWQDVDDKDERLRFGLFVGTAFGLTGAD